MTLEADWQHLMDNRHFVLATSKLPTLDAAIMRWKPAAMSLLNPEHGVKPFVPEPRNAKPQETALHKVARVKGSKELPQGKEKLYLATDVAFSMGTQDRGFRNYHKIERRADETAKEYEQRLLQIATRRYTRQEFIARWDIGVAAGEENVPHDVSTEIRIQTNLSALREDQLKNKITGKSNAIFKAVEHARNSGADFEVYLQGNPEPFIVKNKDSAILELWIVEKLPFEGMVVDLYKTLAKEVLHSEDYRLINASLAHLLTTLQ